MPKNINNDITATLESWVQDMQSAVGSSVADVPSDVGEWAVRAGILLDRGLFSFNRHEYLRTPYSDNHPYQVEMKCTQMGNTVRAILRTLHCALYYRNLVGVIYLFPSRRGSGDFSRSRITPMITANPDSLGRYIKETDSVELKRVAGKNIYFRGTKSKEGLLSDPADLIVYDEYDLFPKGIEGVAEGRLAHSDFMWQHFLSNPSLPKIGIDAKFALTDQRYWLLRCPKCGGYTCMEDHFPECLQETSAGEVIRLCTKCRDAELNPAMGEWVARKPSITDKRGYHYSQLWSQYVTPKSILDQYQSGENLRDLFNFKIGFPYVEAENKLDIEEVLQLCGNHGLASSDPGPCFMGVDQGNHLHVVVGKMHPDRLVHVYEYLEWEDMDRLIKSFNVSLCVVDAMPEKRNARALAERFPGKVYLNFYNHHQKGDYVWNEPRKLVSSNRTESLDASHTALQGAKISLPKRCGPVEEFALHCSNMAREIKEEDDGSVLYNWINTGPDHYRHAFNYAWIARSRIAGAYFGDADLS